MSFAKLTGQDNEHCIEPIKEEPEVEVVPILPVAEWLAEDERMGASTFEVRVNYWKAWLRILGRQGGTK